MNDSCQVLWHILSYRVCVGAFMLRKSLFLAPILLVTVSSSCAFALDRFDGPFAQALDAYAKKDFARVCTLLEAMLLTSPKEPHVHYLLGHAYLASSKNELAEREYQTCLKLCPVSDLANQCNKALDQIKKLKSQSPLPVQTAATPTQLPPPPMPPAMPPCAAAQSPLVNPTLALNERRLFEEQQELLRKEDEKQRQTSQHYKNLSDTAVQKIRSDMEFQLSHISRYTYDHKGRSHKNPHYDAEAAILKEEADRKIKAVLDAQERNTVTVTRAGDKARDDVLNMASNLRDAVASDKGNVRVMPTGSGIRTKNYVNFGDDEPDEPIPPAPLPALKAERSTVKVKRVAP
jgi:hypothetical protein